MQTKPPSNRSFYALIGIVIFVISAGSVFYHHVEKLAWLDSVYFSVITLTTVGYGDITPHTDPGKIFTIFYVLIGVGIIATSLNLLVRSAAQRRVEKHQERTRKVK